MKASDRERFKRIVDGHPCPQCGKRALEDGPMEVWAGSDMVWLACEAGHTWTVAKSSRGGEAGSG